MSVTAKPSVQTQKVHIIVVVSTDIRVMVKIVQVQDSSIAPSMLLIFLLFLFSCDEIVSVIMVMVIVLIRDVAKIFQRGGFT